VRAIEPEKGEIAIDNPNSAAVWSYGQLDANNDKKTSFTEQFHRSISSAVIKNDILIAPDFSGLVHCLNAKTGQRYWTCDLLAAVWGTPLIVGDRAYVPDEDGDIAILHIHPDFERSTQQLQNYDDDSRQPLHEIPMGNSVYSTPVFANGVLYIANKSHLFAIAEPAPSKPSAAQQPPNFSGIQPPAR
jgi:outer membrane protein assembly factor BamB